MRTVNCTVRPIAARPTMTSLRASTCACERSPSRTVSVCIMARCLDAAVAGEDRVEALEELRRRDLGEEADAAEVHAEQ